LETSKGTCTGTLVGIDLVLTNAHCIIDNLEEDGAFAEEIRFKLRLRENRPLATATVTEVVGIGTYTHIEAPMHNPEDDWAILRIDRNLGEDFGYLGWRVLDFTDNETLESLEGQVRLAGYSFDFPTDKYSQYGRVRETAGVHAGCSVRGLSENFGIAISENASISYDPTGTNVTEGILLHDCDSLQGSSGSALIALFDDGNYYIVGLHANDFPVPSASPEHNSVGQCALYRPNSSGEWDFREINGSCFNGAVQVSRWAEQAAEVRTES
jgi:protease YdgD